MCSAEWTQARQRANEAEASFAEVEEARLKLLREAFEHVAGQIESIYKDLTRSSTHPMGGTAKLAMDLDNPFDGTLHCTGVLMALFCFIGIHSKCSLAHSFCPCL